ncbi:MAG: hypothetical protein AAFY17_08185, partial [Cyanobacteria bacterium J06642_11]
MGYREVGYTETVEAEGKVSVLRTCDFCQTEYHTPPTTVKSIASDTVHYSDWSREISRMLGVYKDAASMAADRLERQKSIERKWLLEKSGRYKVGVLCPNCLEFSLACTEKHFRNGKKEFFLGRFQRYVWFEMWIKVSF